MIIGIDASRLTARVMTGTERYTREVIPALIRLAPPHSFRIYVREPCDPMAALGIGADTVASWEIVYIEQARLWTHIGLAREIAVRPPDALFIPAHVLPLPQAIRRTTRTVVAIHDVGYRHFPRVHPLRQRTYLDWSTWLSTRFASAIVVDSEATRRDVMAFYGTPATRISIAYPGPIPLEQATPETTATIRAKYRIESRQPYALFIGTMQPRKNLHRLIVAWRLMLEVLAHDAAKLPAPVLLIAGAQGWGHEDLISEVTRLGLNTTVRFLGYIDDKEKTVLLQGASAFVFPSLHEGFGFPVLEAQQAGVPVACSNTSSLPEVAGAGGLLFDPLDIDAISSALRHVLFDDSLREKLVTAGKENVKRFSWQNCAEVILHKLENDGMINGAIRS